MSFISSRARALRQRFGSSQPSLTDNWDTGCNQEYIDDDPRVPSPDIGGSMLSLLNEPEATWQEGEEKSPVFRAQRSKSLDSLTAISVAPLSPPANLQLRSEVFAATSPSSKIPRPQPPKLMEPSVPAFSGPLIHDFPESLSPGSIIPRIPGPPPSPQKSPSTLSAPTTPRYGEPYSPLTPKFPEAPVIPKIPGPPPSPKVSRPSTPKAKEPPSPKFSEASIIPKIPGPPVSPKHSRPTTPKQNEGILVDTSKPSVLQLSQSHSRPASPLLNELSTKEITKSPKLRDPPASPRSPQRSVKKPPDESVPIDEELNIVIPPTVAEHPQPPNQLSVVCDIYESPKSSPVRKPSVKRPLQRCLTLPTKERDDSESLLATMPEKIVEDPGKIPEGESFDQEENRDTVADGCLPTRPTLFDLRPRPKLKTQWSMDDSRSNRVPAGVPSIKPAEKRRRFFMRKQTNSAPDSFEGPGHLSIKPKEHHSVSFCLGSVRKCRGSDSSIQPPTLPTISKYALQSLSDINTVFVQ
ncbi:uncharacterized protein LOC126249470 [Schistocerca nitens]|uniref:uncharacterized protein LOC126249470 n=1 Tax=Schistocerca nitens TaxID=7011 RepID=UPI0021181F63|nr:uncharacterized protein LOC126249470 [Schistocerca nitens]